MLHSDSIDNVIRMVHDLMRENDDLRNTLLSLLDIFNVALNKKSPLTKEDKKFLAKMIIPRLKPIQEMIDPNHEFDDLFNMFPVN